MAEETARDILHFVYDALEEKGYSPIDQLTGYLASGDYTYITVNRGARSKLMHIERDELLEELLRSFFDRG